MKKFILYLTLSVFTSLTQSQTQYPPISPKWVFESWVWEDATNTDSSTLALINGYLNRDIPVGAVIIDSPWETEYNTFVFDTSRYKDPEVLINDSLKNKDIHVILWITGVIDTCCSLYDSAKFHKYFINDGAPTKWWRGCGWASHIDFFNRDAVEYWEGLMDSVFNNYEVDGWKVDETDSYLSDQVMTKEGIKTKREYSDAYYSEIYNYTHVKRGDKGMITARPFYNYRWYAPVSVNTAGWVGDQINSWDGLQNALNNIFISASMGYGAVGFDIGGYSNDSLAADKTLFLRWAQLGALVPIMENGGTSDSCHKPWLFDDTTVIIYRYFANLHHELVPYLYSYDIAAHLTATSILRPFGTNSPDPNIWTDPDCPWRYLLGDNFFISAIYHDGYSRQITFPEGSWINYWNEDDVHHGGTAQLNYSLDQYPLFIRSGAIIPMNVDDSITGHGSEFSKNYLTLLIYPDGSSSYRYYTDEFNSTEIKCDENSSGFTISFSKSTAQVIIRLKNKIEPGNVRLSSNVNLEKKNSYSAFEESSSGWFQGKMHDDQNVNTWIKFNDPTDTVYVTTTCSLDLHPANYLLSNLKEGKNYYIDRDEYTLITIPDEYKGSYMIKTANDDKATLNLGFHFNICSSANVYIAYDHRIPTPLWITENYSNTGEKIYVTDANLEYFNIWKRTVQPGVVTFGDNEGNSESSMYFVFYQLHEALCVNAKVFLQGPYAGGDTMQTTLWQNNLIPKSQPYNTLTWNYSGTESVSTIPPGAVDWVLVELRTGTTSFTRAAFIKSDGTLVDLDGKCPVRFSGISAGAYYIVIKHRNHLAAMSASPVSLPNSLAYDFTTGSDKYYGSTLGTVELETNAWGMIAGDGNGNGQVQNNDSEEIWKPDNGISGYKNADYNMNGEVQNNDNENYWKVNNGRGTQVPNL